MNKRVLSVRHAVAGKIVSAGLCWGLTGWLLLGLAVTAAAQMPPARVSVAVVQKGGLATGQRFVGTVMPLRTSTVGSPVEGLVEELSVREGDAVKKGDTLAQLRTDQLLIQLAAARAQLELRKHELAELNKSLPEQIKQAAARLQAAEALMTFALSRLSRAQTLFKTRTISEDELQEKESAALATQKKHEENRLAYELAKAIAPVKILQAQARVDFQKEETLRLEDDIAEHTIVAPFGGFVTEEYTEVGQWIAKGDPVVQVVEVDSVEVEISVLESHISEVRVGMTARVEIGALPGKWWDAPVAAIVPQADVRSRSFPVKVRLKNRPLPSGGHETCPSEWAGGVLFKPGMFARVTLPSAENPNALLVPKDAVVLGGRSKIVYVADPMPKGSSSKGRPPKGPPGRGAVPAGPAPDGTARAVPIEVVKEVGASVAVRGQLKAGDLVVVEGNERLAAGQPLIIVNRDQLLPRKPAERPSK